MIYKLEATFLATGSVLDKKKLKKKRLILTKEMGEIIAGLEASPKNVTAPIGCRRCNKID
jgi:hypothetical protein